MRRFADPEMPLAELTLCARRRHLHLTGEDTGVGNADFPDLRRMSGFGVAQRNRTFAEKRNNGRDARRARRGVSEAPLAILTNCRARLGSTGPSCVDLQRGTDHGTPTRRDLGYRRGRLPA